MAETNQYQLIKKIENFESEISSLKKLMNSHIHDGFTSQKINNKNIVYDIVKPTFLKQELADDEYITFPENNGTIIVSIGDSESDIDEVVLTSVASNGSVYLLAKTVNVDNTDSDGNLCVFNNGVVDSPEVLIKNRLGSKKIIKYINFS